MNESDALCIGLLQAAHRDLEMTDHITMQFRWEADWCDDVPVVGQ